MSEPSGWLQVGPFLILIVLGLISIAALPALGVGIISYLAGYGFWLNALIAWAVFSAGLNAFYLRRS